MSRRFMYKKTGRITRMLKTHCRSRCHGACVSISQLAPRRSRGHRGCGRVPWHQDALDR